MTPGNSETKAASTQWLACGSAWNRFWFTPSDPVLVCLLRLLVGAAGLYYLLSFTPGLVRWFGQDGLLPASLVNELTNSFHWSYWKLVDVPRVLWMVHGIGLIVLVLFTVGLCTRVTAVLALAAVLSYIHRAPMIAGPFESVLSMLLLYLCLAPCGRYFSVDAYRKGSPNAERHVTPSVAATVSVRLMQVHLALLYLMFGLSKLAGETWWAGEAVWWLIARTESRLVDFTGLHDSIYLINLWTHAVVVYELTFAVLIWRPLARPILLLISLLMWGSLALLTGLISFSAIMLIANLCFVPPSTVRRFVARRRSAVGV